MSLALFSHLKEQAKLKSHKVSVAELEILVENVN